MLQDADGDYVSEVISSNTETLGVHFKFTKRMADAKVFGNDELWSQSTIAVEFVMGFAGGRSIRVK